MALSFKRRASAHNKLPSPSLFPPTVTASHLNEPAAHPAPFSRTKNFSLRPWTGLHTQNQPCLFPLSTRYTRPSSQCSNALFFCFSRPLLTESPIFSMGTLFSAYEFLCKALSGSLFVTRLLPHRPYKNHALLFSRKKKLVSYRLSVATRLT